MNAYAFAAPTSCYVSWCDMMQKNCNQVWKFGINFFHDRVLFILGIEKQHEDVSKRKLNTQHDATFKTESNDSTPADRTERRFSSHYMFIAILSRCNGCSFDFTRLVNFLPYVWAKRATLLLPL